MKSHIFHKKYKNIFDFLIVFLILNFLFLILAFAPQGVKAQSASLYLAPSRGTFFVGSTFSISIYLDTKGNKINAVEVDLKFPPNILQVTAPTAGESFISEWLTPPSYSNIGGGISFKGGIPEGIVTSAGLVSTITFRAKSSGKAKVEFLDSSKVLLADGKGTSILTSNIDGAYEILVPPPEGPKISSPTHPDPEIWYSNSSPSFSWEKTNGVTDFSFSFSQNSQENPDIISEGNYTFQSYEEVSDGIWYFHLRAKKKGSWGRTSHFLVRVDTSPPQKFEPKAETYSGFIYFESKDFHSGIDYYEISILNISENPSAALFFIEATSPFKSPERRPGKYQVIVRAYDRAGNYQTAENRFQMLSPIISIEETGIRLRGVFFPRWVICLILFVLIGVIGYLPFYLSRHTLGFNKLKKEIKETLSKINKIKKVGFNKMIKEIKETLTKIKKIKKVGRLKENFREGKEQLEEKLKEE